MRNAAMRSQASVRHRHCRRREFTARFSSTDSRKWLGRLAVTICFCGHVVAVTESSPSSKSAQLSRNNQPVSAGLPWVVTPPDDMVSPGYYYDWRKAVPVFCLFLLWIWTMRRMDEDAASLRIPHARWNALLFGSGLLGTLAALCLPFYLLGYTVMLLAYAVPVSLYVAHRNLLVPTARRAFTTAHLQKLPGQFLTALGGIVRGPSGDAAGLPVVFLSKTITGDGGDVVQAQSSRGHRAARELIYEAVTRRATDIHLEPNSNNAVSVRIRIDGTLDAADPFDRRLGNSVINIFKILSALDISDKRRSQDGSFRAEVDHRVLDFRVATQATQYGEKLSIRILDPAHSLASLGALGMRRSVQDSVRACLDRTHGLLLICGPTGAGKTTTLFAALRELDTHGKNVISVEDPIEYNMPGVNQIEVNRKAGQTFAGALRHLLRQDPDVLLIGEIRDAETADIACQAANTGHMVFTTIHANNTVAALYRLLELGVEPYMASNSITAILGQRLLRRLCPDCKIGFEPDTRSLAELGLPRDNIGQLFRADTGDANACESCHGSGYLGRIAVFELLEISPQIREMIGKSAPAADVLHSAREEGMLSLREEGVGLVARGIVSLEELARLIEEQPA